jgi:hypothetical protein
MAFTVISNSFKDGDYLANDFILSADFGFGCAGGNKSPHLKWSDAPAETKSFAITCYDPDAPTGSGFWHWLGRWQRQWETACGRIADTHRFRRAWLRRPVSTRGRPSAPLSVHRVRRENRHARREGRHIGGGRRLQLAFQYAGEGGDYGVVQEVNRPWGHD